VSEASWAIIQYLQDHPILPQIDVNVSMSAIQNLYKVWNENTTTSPSGIHLGHDKCPLKYADTTQQPTLASRIYKLKTQFINLALRHGVIYQRWQHINTIMIEKIPGVYRIDKLRALHIFESDLNGILGILWGRRLMDQAERNRVLSDAQHGSRKGRGTETILLTKHLTYAIWRLTTSNGMSFDNDAKACYDRIVMNLALIASQHMGMPPEICEWYSKILKTAKYHIQLPNITSETSYHHTTTHPLHGPGQGSRAAPSLWVVVSSLIMFCF